jgi:alpha-L-fucosidase
VPSWEWRSTTKPGKAYVEIFKWPAGTLHHPAVTRKVSGAYLLADPAHKKLKITQTDAGVDVELPGAALDPVATVVVLETP